MFHMPFLYRNIEEKGLSGNEVIVSPKTKRNILLILKH